MATALPQCGGNGPAGWVCEPETGVCLPCPVCEFAPITVHLRITTHLPGATVPKHEHGRRHHWRCSTVVMHMPNCFPLCALGPAVPSPWYVRLASFCLTGSHPSFKTQSRGCPIWEGFPGSWGKDSFSSLFSKRALECLLLSCSPVDTSSELGSPGSG